MTDRAHQAAESLPAPLVNGEPDDGDLGQQVRAEVDRAIVNYQEEQRLLLRHQPKRMH